MIIVGESEQSVLEKQRKREKQISRRISLISKINR